MDFDKFSGFVAGMAIDAFSKQGMVHLQGVCEIEERIGLIQVAEDRDDAAAAERIRLVLHAENADKYGVFYAASKIGQGSRDLGTRKGFTGTFPFDVSAAGEGPEELLFVTCASKEGERSMKAFAVEREPVLRIGSEVPLPASMRDAFVDLFR